MPAARRLRGMNAKHSCEAKLVYARRYGPHPAAAMTPPYRAQWESPALVPEFLTGTPASADPAWASSGAASVEEYARWADHLCGCACLQMALGARGRDVPPIHAIRRGVQRRGGYMEEADGTIRGLIYAGAVAWLADHGIAAEVRLDVTARHIAGFVAAGALFIASVHPAIRWPDRDPPARGGHLVLVFGAALDGALRFHNPSGHTAVTRRDVRMDLSTFSRFHAERGILIGPCAATPG